MFHGAGFGWVSMGHILLLPDVVAARVVGGPVLPGLLCTLLCNGEHRERELS